MKILILLLFLNMNLCLASEITCPKISIKNSDNVVKFEGPLGPIYKVFDSNDRVLFEISRRKSPFYNELYKVTSGVGTHLANITIKLTPLGSEIHFYDCKNQEIAVMKRNLFKGVFTDTRHYEYTKYNIRKEDIDGMSHLDTLFYLVSNYVY